MTGSGNITTPANGEPSGTGKLDNGAPAGSGGTGKVDTPSGPMPVMPLPQAGVRKGFAPYPPNIPPETPGVVDPIQPGTAPIPGKIQRGF